MSIDEYGTYFITGTGNNKAIDQTEYSKIIKNPLNKLGTSQRWAVGLHPSSVKLWSFRNEKYKTFLRPGPNFNELVTSESAFYWRTHQASTQDPNLNVFVFSTNGPGDDPANDNGYYAYWGPQGDNVRLAYSTFDNDDTKSWYFEKAM